MFNNVSPYYINSIFILTKTLTEIRKFVEEYRFGEEMLYQKNGHQTIWISSVTEVGLPTEFKIEVPWMFRGRSVTDSHRSRGLFSTQFKAMLVDCFECIFITMKTKTKFLS